MSTVILARPFPVNCLFQYHVGSALVIAVHADNHPVKSSYDSVVITGVLQLIDKDPENGTLYRLLDVKQVNQ